MPEGNNRPSKEKRKQRRAQVAQVMYKCAKCGWRNVVVKGSFCDSCRDKQLNSIK
ncbi:MAG TPA: hypothetical protein PLP33_25325 [Leptospiraceae bacterium]|nr:hypothetical protein [Leptospiraceae bacterium]